MVMLYVLLKVFASVIVCITSTTTVKQTNLKAKKKKKDRLHKSSDRAVIKAKLRQTFFSVVEGDYRGTDSPLI
jgi:hypothetical protein